MKMNCVADNKKHYFESAEDFILWATSQDDRLKLTAEEAKLILGYVEGHGYGLCLDEHGTMFCVDLEEPENEPVVYSLEELMERVSQWNYEFLVDDTVTGDWRENVLKDATVIESVLDRTGARDGFRIGKPTVKSLIAILSKLPQDYTVTCGGGENYLYLFPKEKLLSIDSE